MSIRLAENADLPAILKIYNQAVRAGQCTAHTSQLTLEDMSAWFAEHSAEKYPVYVYQEEGSVLAYSSVSVYRRGRSALRYTAEISFYVDFAHHRNGIASRLIEHVLAQCTHLRIKNLFAIIMENNKSSIDLLKSFDFSEWAHLPRVADYDGIELGQVYYGRRIDI